MRMENCKGANVTEQQHLDGFTLSDTVMVKLISSVHHIFSVLHKESEQTKFFCLALCEVHETCLY